MVFEWGIEPPAGPISEQSAEWVRTEWIGRAVEIGVFFALAVIAPPPGQGARFGSVSGSVNAVEYDLCRLLQLRLLRRLALLGVLQLGAEQPGVELAGTFTDLVRGGFGDDEETQHQQQDDDDRRADRRHQRAQRCRDHPADHSSREREGLHPLAGHRRSAKNVAKTRNRDEQDNEADADAAVVVNRTGFAEEPDREEQHDDRKRKGNAPKQAAESPRVERLGDRVVDQEPLDDSAGDRHEHEKERRSVATLLLRQLLRSEGASGTTGQMCHRHPEARQQVGFRLSHWIPHSLLCSSLVRGLPRGAAARGRAAGTTGRLSARSHGIYGTAAHRRSRSAHAHTVDQSNAQKRSTQ